jgi:mono/diheme cytochrome c family protein
MVSTAKAARALISPLREYRMGGSDQELFQTIRTGVPGSEMPAVRVSDDEVWKLVAYVARLGSSGLAEKAPGDVLAGKALYARNGCAAVS